MNVQNLLESYRNPEEKRIVDLRSASKDGYIARILRYHRASPVPK
jgi:hypothetical protein